MKLVQLEMLLETIDGFDNPKIQLEQYETGHHIGARMLFTMNSYDDIEDKIILDLGTGCGRLGLSCACLNAAFVLGVDIDPDAIEKCVANRKCLQEDEEPNFLNNFDTICADVCDNSIWSRCINNSLFDVVIMNPPFGTKNNKGIDMMFLRRALELSSGTVYSLHKTSTRDHVLRKAHDFGAKGKVLAKLRYDLPRTYKFHQKHTKDIEVDFFRFEKLNH